MNLSHYSLGRRLTLGLLAVVLVVTILLSAVGAMLFDQSLRSLMANDLQRDAESVLHSLVRSSEGIRPESVDLDSAYQRPFSGRYYQITKGKKGLTREWRSRSLWDVELPVLNNEGLSPILVPGPMGQRLLVWRSDFKRFGTAITITTARDYTPVLETFWRLGKWLLALIITALGLLAIFQQRVVNHALKPLTLLARQIADIHSGKRDRLDSVAARELALLQDEINRLLSHTQKVVNQNRHAVSDLGHSLKTPLAVLASLTDETCLQNNPELRNKLRSQLNDIRERLDRVLNRARLGHAVLPGDFFIPADDVPILMESLRQIHGERLELHWTCNNERPIPLTRHDVLELLGNLLDNACKWANACAQLDIRMLSDSVEFIVDDDGPGVEDSDHTSILERGRRLSEAQEGHGLGLSIVKDIVTHHEGILRFERSPMGGLRIRIIFTLV